MKNKGGRKSWTEELQIAQRYADLSEEYFAFLKEMYESEDKADKKWATEQLSKAYTKMIPQDLNLGGKKDQPILVKFMDDGESDRNTT